MEALSICILYEFAISNPQLSWKEIFYAITHGLLAPYSAVEHAMAKIRPTQDYSDSLAMLASLNTR